MTGIINRSATARFAIRRSIVVRACVRARITWITVALPNKSRIKMVAANTVTTIFMVMPTSSSIVVDFGGVDTLPVEQ